MARFKFCELWWYIWKLKTICVQNTTILVTYITATRWILCYYQIHFQTDQKFAIQLPLLASIHCCIELKYLLKSSFGKQNYNTGTENCPSPPVLRIKRLLLHRYFRNIPPVFFNWFRDHRNWGAYRHDCVLFTPVAAHPKFPTNFWSNQIVLLVIQQACKFLLVLFL